MVEERDLGWAALELAHEWTELAGIAGRLALVEGNRTPQQESELIAGLLRYRCLVNFLCGNATGWRHPADVQPSDFLGHDWWPHDDDDDEIDRRLRGRLVEINKALFHVSWDRVDLTILWPMGLLAHEVDWSMRQFLAEADAGGAAWFGHLERAADEVRAALPPRERWTSTKVAAAPARRP